MRVKCLSYVVNTSGKEYIYAAFTLLFATKNKDQGGKWGHIFTQVDEKLNKEQPNTISKPMSNYGNKVENRIYVNRNETWESKLKVQN